MPCSQMRDGRIAYVDFGNVAQLSQRNKQVCVCVRACVSVRSCVCVCVRVYGRIAYVDFGNVAQLSQRNKQVCVCVRA